MRAMDVRPRAGLEVLSREECLSLMATVSVGRLGVSIDALPAILPVNFVLLREQIIVRTVPGTKLDAAAAQAVVAFEVDSYDPGGKWGWSVLVLGLARRSLIRLSWQKPRPCRCALGRSRTALPTASCASRPLGSAAEGFDTPMADLDLS
jgi:Pyridoxamine 5'-phosphate oxidase